MTTPRIEEMVEKICEFDFENKLWSDSGYNEFKDLLRRAFTEAHQAGIDEERGRCLRWIGTKSAIFNLFNGNNIDLKVSGQDEYKDLIDRIKRGN